MQASQLFRGTANRWTFSIVLLCGFPFCVAGAADATPEAIWQIGSTTRKIEIRDAESLLLEYPDWLTTVKGFDPAVIRVSAVRPNRLRIKRLTPGATTLLAIDRADRQYSIEVTAPMSANEQ